MRAPRIFYGTDFFFKEFVQLDSEIMIALQVIKKGKFKDEKFFGSFMINQGEGQEEI